MELLALFPPYVTVPWTTQSAFALGPGDIFISMNTQIPLIELTCEYCQTTFQHRPISPAKPKFCPKHKSPRYRTNKPVPVKSPGTVYVTSPNGIECVVMGNNKKPVITLRCAEGEFVQLQTKAAK